MFSCLYIRVHVVWQLWTEMDVGLYTLWWQKIHMQYTIYIIMMSMHSSAPLYSSVTIQSNIFVIVRHQSLNTHLSLYNNRCHGDCTGVVIITKSMHLIKKSSETTFMAGFSVVSASFTFWKNKNLKVKKKWFIPVNPRYWSVVVKYTPSCINLSLFIAT